MIHKITVPYFPVALKYTSPLVLGIGVYVIAVDHLVWGIVLVLLSVILLTTHYVTRIDLTKRTYDDYLFFLGLPLNKDSKSFSRIDRIVISRGNYSHTINTRAQSRQLDWSDYTGTLVFDNGTLDLLTKNSKRDLLLGLKEFVRFLKVDIEDRTTAHHYYIDIDKVD